MSPAADPPQQRGLAATTLNQMAAALAERSARLARERMRLREQPASQSRDFALECNAEAIRGVYAAQEWLREQDWPVDAAETFDPAEGSPDPVDAYKRAADMGYSYHDAQSGRLD